MTRWNARLPGDLKRGAFEIYRSMTNSGAATVRDYVRQQYKGSDNADIWTDLWTLATICDYVVSSCRTDVEVMARLNEDDVSELALRRTALYVHEQKSKDKVGARHMLGAEPPGQQGDVAPTWLVAEAIALSLSLIHI